MIKIYNDIDVVIWFFEEKEWDLELVVCIG